MKKSVIIDCDPGIDDAIALLMAFASDKLDVKAITTVAGNVSVRQTTENALRLVALAGCEIEVAAGADRPLGKKYSQAEAIHGSNGLGGVVLHRGRGPSPYGAVQFLQHTIEKSDTEMELITLGPLTNIAHLILEAPASTLRKIKSITIMGGAIGEGNVTPSAEFNFHADAMAADIVFQSGLPLFMYGLNVTKQALLYPEDVEVLEQMGGVVLEKITAMMQWYAHAYRTAGRPGLCMHDPFAMASLIDPTLADMHPFHVEIETENKEFMGQSRVNIDGGTGTTPNALVAMALDRNRFLNLLIELMATYP